MLACNDGGVGGCGGCDGYGGIGAHYDCCICGGFGNLDRFTKYERVDDCSRFVVELIVPPNLSPAIHYQHKYDHYEETYKDQVRIDLGSILD